MNDRKYVIGEMQPSTGGRGVNSKKNKESMLPDNVTITSVALGIRDLVESQVSAALARIEDSARELSARNVDVITMGGLPPIVFGGYGFDKVIIERIGKVTAIPATTGQTSATEAMRLFGAKKIILVTPYKDSINQKVVKFMEASGFEIGSLQTANAAFEDYPKLSSSLSYELSLKGKAESPDAQCIYIPCGAWTVSENINRVEMETGLPVVAGTQSGVWGALRLIGIKAGVPGYGRLLRDY